MTRHTFFDQLLTEQLVESDGIYAVLPMSRIAGISRGCVKQTRSLDAATALLDNGARRYDSYLGRFISPDSIVPDPTNPHSWKSLRSRWPGQSQQSKCDERFCPPATSSSQGGHPEGSESVLCV
jgi:hypothetical protein